MIEKWILGSTGLLEETVPSRDPGDAALKLSSSASVPAWPEVEGAISWRDSFTFDHTAQLSDKRPLVDSPLEREFIQDTVPHAFGDRAGHWFHPQAAFSVLTGDATDYRRADFYMFHPVIPPHVVELDGYEHLRALEVDRERDQALAAAGITPERATSGELDSLARTSLARLAVPGERPADQTLRLVWGPVIAHRIARSMVEAIAEGWLIGDHWRLRVREPTGVAATAVQSALDLLSAVADVWGVPLAPEQVTLETNEDRLGYRRMSPGRYEPQEADHGSGVDVDISVEPYCGPWHRLPQPAHRSVIVRSAPLPVSLREGRLEGGSRRSIPEMDRVDRRTLERLLHGLFAKREFYPAQAEHPRGQEVAIRRVLAGLDAAVLLPTGAGKSLIYQFAALLLPGRTLVIDPIVALIDDQLDGLAAQGIDRAIGITRADKADNVLQAKLQAVANGDALFCFVAPERLQQRKFRDAVRALTVASPINLCVVDEAHCVSEWGHDFRTSYLDIGRVLREVCADTSGAAPPILALTGTASRSVLRDMLIELDIDRSDPEAIVSPQDFDRPELTFSVVKAREDEVISRLIGTLRSLPSQFGVPESEFFRAAGDDTYSGIVFSQTVDPPKNRPDGGLLNLQAALEGGFGLRVGMYSGKAPNGWRGDDWELVKKRFASSFKRNRLPVLVATKAYGMGIDKPNVRYIVHAGVSGSIEAYYQEAGRAGRDRQRAHCVIVHDELDRGFWDYAHSNSFGGIDGDVAMIEQMLDLIGEAGARRTVFVPKSLANQPAENEERAIHRLKLLGVIRDYLVDWGGARFELLLADTDPAAVDRAFIQYVRRTQPARVKAFERELVTEPVTDLRMRIVADARRLVTFIYETVVMSRRAALDEMVRMAEQARNDTEIREWILEYLKLGEVAQQLATLIDLPSFGFGDWQDLYHQLDSVDDAREWRGATARFLESSPDHPGLLIGRALAEAIVPNGDPLSFARNLESGLASATGAYLADPEDALTFLEWLLAWLHERKTEWSALGFLVAERHLGDDHLAHLSEVEFEVLSDQRSYHPDELAVVASRRTDRLAATLETVATRALELTA